MNAKKDENEDVLDLVDAVYEYLTKAQYPMDCTATKKRQIRKKALELMKENLSTFQTTKRFVYILNYINSL